MNHNGHHDDGLDSLLRSLTSEHSPVLRQLGSVVGGSLSGGLEVRLDPDVDVEEMAVGRYVTVEAHGQLFFGMITDVELRMTMDALLPVRHRGRCARGNDPRGGDPTVSFRRLARI